MLKKIIVFLGIALMAAGCGTIMDGASVGCAATKNGPRVYGGVQTDAEQIGRTSSWVATVVLLIDIVPSIAYDTILLPISITRVSHQQPPPAK